MDRLDTCERHELTAAITSCGGLDHEVRRRTRDCRVRGIAGQMDDELTELVGRMRTESTVRAVNRLCATGAAAPDETMGDELVALSRSRPEGLAKVTSLLEEGPAAAVDDADAFYSIGMPFGLPGGLAGLCISKRVEVLERVAHVRALRVARDEARELGGAQSRVQGKARKAGRFDTRGFSQPSDHAPAWAGGSTENAAAVASAGPSAAAAASSDGMEMDSEEADEAQAAGVQQQKQQQQSIHLPQYRPRRLREGVILEQQAFNDAATALIGWLFEHRITDEAACATAGVSVDFLHKKHKATGMSRADLLRPFAVRGGKVQPRRRGDRTGLPPVEG
jgi:hypothetical protein